MGRVFNRPQTGEIVVEGSGGQTRWSSQFPPVNLLPQSSWIETPLSVEFPDFTKFVNYGHARYFNPPSFNFPDGTWSPGSSGDTCTSVTMIAPEERVLSAIDLGTVPQGTNYIDVRVRLNRTKAPYAFRDQVPPPLVPNEWVSLPGGSCIVEATEIWRRSFDIILSGRTIQLVRRQSVIDLPTLDPPKYTNGPYLGIYGNDFPLRRGSSDAARNAWGQSTYQVWGWINGGNFAGSQRDGHPAALIQAKPFGDNPGTGTPTYGGKHPTRGNACSINNSHHDFSSIYAGQIVIRPGYIRP